jgi:hypothetical protein
MRKEELYNTLIEFGVLIKIVGLNEVYINDTYSKLPIQNVLKQGDALSPLIFNISLEYTIRKVQENKVGLKVNGTHQLLAYSDDRNLLENIIDTIKENIKETPWSESARELYRPSDCRLSVK